MRQRETGSVEPAGCRPARARPRRRRAARRSGRSVQTERRGRRLGVRRGARRGPPLGRRRAGRGPQSGRVRSTRGPHQTRRRETGGRGRRLDVDRCGGSGEGSTGVASPGAASRGRGRCLRSTRRRSRLHPAAMGSVLSEPSGGVPEPAGSATSPARGRAVTARCRTRRRERIRLGWEPGPGWPPAAPAPPPAVQTRRRPAPVRRTVGTRRGPEREAVPIARDEPDMEDPVREAQ